MYKILILTAGLLLPAIGFGANPLSVVTSESLRDLGYEVTSSPADPFFFTFGGLVSPDSGPAHLASCVGTPVIGLYAATPGKR